MEPVIHEFKSVIEETEFKIPICPIYQNTDGRPSTDTKIIKNKLLDQLTHPVMWRHTILHMIEDGATEFTEIGPGNLLSKFVDQIDRTALTRSVS